MSAVYRLTRDCTEGHPVTLVTDGEQAVTETGEFAGGAARRAGQEIYVACTYPMHAGGAGLHRFEGDLCTDEVEFVLHDGARVQDDAYLVALLARAGEPVTA